LPADLFAVQRDHDAIARLFPPPGTGLEPHLRTMAPGKAAKRIQANGGLQQPRLTFTQNLPAVRNRKAGQPTGGLGGTKGLDAQSKPFRRAAHPGQQRVLFPIEINRA